MVTDKSVVLIGGTFNPFTNAHKEMAISVRGLLAEADIVYIPSNMGYISEWKDIPSDNVFSGRNRSDLISESIKDISNCYVSNIESTGKITGRTYETVQYFKEKYERVYICIGSDKLTEFEKWYKAEELIKEVEVLLFTRGKAVIDCSSEFIKKYRGKITEVDFNFPEISSSLVRDMYNKGKIVEIKKYVPYPVYEYLGKAREMYVPQHI